VTMHVLVAGGAGFIGSNVEHLDWRPGDLRIWISDLRRAPKEHLDREATVPPKDWYTVPLDWIGANPSLFL
jgi:nucleoside-diphosphate-sugar epimerase